MITVNGKRTGYISLFASIDANSSRALLTNVERLMKEGAEAIVLLMSTTGGMVF